NNKDPLKKLSEDSLTKQPEEVFDVLEKLGEGSYGCVFKAHYKETGEIVAIKQVPVESDLQEIIKEISIMQQCNSPHVVRYYGSYFKNTDLWIVMEYCGAGSVSDIIRIRNKTAIFMIPTNPPPTFRNPDLWSPGFRDFVSQCLVKNPENRATATQLLQHPFIKSAKPNSILRALITDAMEIKLKRQEEEQREQDADDDENSSTIKIIVCGSPNYGVCVCRSDSLRLIYSKVNVGLAVCFTGRDETMQPAKPAKPSFLEYFEQKEKEANIHNDGGGKGQNNADNLEVVSWKRGAHCYTLLTWSVEDLRLKLASLDPQMEQEIEEIRQRYQAKRQPILDAIEAKKRRQPNF
uniref:non-specific serine/threonine protein kinase n=1 Tax=Neolamprologus brichardi TaxID=32507 RepID=A0A3Q4GZI3_NEOBR